MSKDEKQAEIGKPERKIGNHNWQRTITVRKEYPCEICGEKIEVGAKAKYRVKEDNIVVHAHAECVKKGKDKEASHKRDVIKAVREKHCIGCKDRKGCLADCAAVLEGIAKSDDEER